MNPFPGEFSDDEGLSRAEIRAKKRRRMMRKRRTTVIVAVCVLVFGLGGFFGLRAAGGVVDDLFGGGGDYEGNGTTEVTLEIPPGASARSVANQLVEEGVIKDSKPFLEEVERRDLTIQAGPVILREQMSSKAAVDAFINPIKPPKLTIAEGRKIDQIKATMIESGMKAEEVDKAIDDRTPKDYGLDVDAPSLEGYLYPATYDLDKAKTAEDIVSEMVAKTKLELETAGIENKDANRILTPRQPRRDRIPGGRGDTEEGRPGLPQPHLGGLEDRSAPSVRCHGRLHPRRPRGPDDDEGGAELRQPVQHVQAGRVCRPDRSTRRAPGPSTPHSTRRTATGSSSSRRIRTPVRRSSPTPTPSTRRTSRSTGHGPREQDG